MMTHHILLSPFMIVALLIVMLLASSKTRVVAFILLGSLVALMALGLFAYRTSRDTEISHANSMAQLNFPRSGIQISQNNDWPNTPRTKNALSNNGAMPVVGSPPLSPHYQPKVQMVGQSPSLLSDDVQISPTISFAQHPSMASWVKIGILALPVLLLLGGLVFTITMLSIPKTRTFGIVLLVAGSILILPIVASLFWFGSSYTPSTATEVPTTISDSAWTTETIKTPGSAIPLPPGYTAEVPPMPSQPQPENTPAPNSKQIVQAYESAIQYYGKAIAQPLKLDKTEKITEKVSTLHINLQDLGHVTISGSSLLINSIGQAMAKAMTDRMKNGDTQMNITPDGSAQVAEEASFPANSVEQTAPAKDSLKNGTSPVESPVKKSSVELAKTPKPGIVEIVPADVKKLPSNDRLVQTANSPIVSNVETADLSKTHSAETVITPPASKRPDWVDQDPFLWQAGKGTELPDYYKIVNSKPVDGDAYVMCVSTDPYTTKQECEAKIPEILQSAVDQFAEKYLRRNWNAYVQLSPDQLRQFVVAEYPETKDFSFGKMTQVHLLLNFDQKAKTLIDDIISIRLFNNRAAIVGTGFVSLWLLLATFWGYLKLDLTTQGNYRKRLRAAAAFAIIAILWTGWLVLGTLVA
jgi:hypothetical protein